MMFDIERDVAYINHVSIQSQLSINYESIKKKKNIPNVPYT